MGLGAGEEPARVIGQDRDRWSIVTRAGPGIARLASAASRRLSPVVGDWVVVVPGPAPTDPHSLVGILPRMSAFRRGAAGAGDEEHVLAANIDVVWIVHGLDLPPNLRRTERYLALAWESGAMPALVLTKADLAADLSGAMAGVQQVALGTPVRAVSTSDPLSVRALRGSLAPGQTVVLLGPSGAGKSTLVNLLAEEDVTATGHVRDKDRKGRHTTTRRELFRVPGGALLLDTPGLRELRVWDLGDGLSLAFPEIEALAASCRFADCSHGAEPGCAVLEAAATGALDAERLASFRKLRAEAAFEARKSDPRARAALVSEHKTAMKTMKHHPKFGR